MKQLEVKQIKGLAAIHDWKIKAGQIEQQTEEAQVNTINWATHPYCPEVKFHTAWSDTTFYLLFDVTEDAIRAVNTTFHSPVYEDSCVEFFLQHEGETAYRNFEFNCIGTALAAVRESRTQCRHYASEEMEKITVHTSLPKTPVTINSSTHWQLLAEIPFSLMGISDKESPVGKTFRANFYKCGDKTPTPHYLSWNPILTEQPDFHRPEFFGELRLES